MKFLTPLVLLIASIGLFFWYIDPQYAVIRQLMNDKSQYETTLKNAQNAQVQLSTLTATYNSFSTDDLNRIQTALPDRVDPIRLVIEVNALAQRYGTPIRNLVLPTTNQAELPATTNSAYATTPLTFTISLTYQNFLSFLNDLEQNLRITDISTVQFAPTDAGIYDYTISINTYSLN